jgi:hypothetical protein
MVETFTITSILAVIGVFALRAFFKAREAARRNSPEEIRRLRTQSEWLAHRLDVAQRENWSQDMIANMTRERAAALAQIAQAELAQRN